MLTVRKNNSSIYSPSGSAEADVYAAVFDETTKISFVKKVKSFDLNEFIQASAVKTDLAVLRQQMLETGQIPIVDDEVDQTAMLMPTNIHELYDVVNSVDKTFNSLPDGVRAVFKDKDDFLNSLVGGTYQARITKYFSDVVNSSKDSKDDSTTVKEGD